MPLDIPTYGGEVEFSLANGTLTSSCCTNATLAIDDDISTTAVFTPPGFTTTGDGLSAVYRQDGQGNPQNSFKVIMHTAIEATVDQEYYGSLPSFLNSSDGNIDADWDGWVVPNYSETYTFTLDPGVWADYVDGATGNGAGGINIGGQSLFFLENSLDSHGPASGSIALSAGVPYTIHVDRSDSPNNYFARLLWQSASQAQEIVPESALFSAQPTLAGRYLRVDFGKTIAVTRVRLGLSGAGAGNGAVLLVTPAGSMAPVAYGTTGADGIVQDTALLPPVNATGMIFQPDYSLNTSGLAAADYPTVNVNQLQVYQPTPAGAFGSGCSCDWAIGQANASTEYAEAATSATSYESAMPATSEWTKTGC